MARKKKTTHPPPPASAGTNPNRIDVAALMSGGWEVTYSYGRQPIHPLSCFSGPNYIKLELRRVLAPGCDLTIVLEGPFENVAPELHAILAKMQSKYRS
jgi:hypothetical protein